MVNNLWLSKNWYNGEQKINTRTKFNNDFGLLLKLNKDQQPMKQGLRKLSEFNL